MQEQSLEEGRYVGGDPVGINFVKMFDADKTRMIGLTYDEKNCVNMLSRFHLILERHGQTDRQTDRIAKSISRISTLTRDKKLHSMYCTIEANY